MGRVRGVDLKPGTYTLGPSGGKLLVKTSRGGVAFLVGKNLTIEVTDWEGKLEVGDDPSETRVELTADGGSLQVTDGEGGPVTLTDLDKESLSKTVTEKVLDGTEITFRSDTARASDDGRCIQVAGELHMFDEKTALEFELRVEPEDEEDEESDEDEESEDEANDEDETDQGGDDEDATDQGATPQDETDHDEKDDEGQKDDEDQKDDEGDDGGDKADEDEDEDDEATEGEDEERRVFQLSGRAAFKQTDVGLEPHSTLLGLLKVRDEVEITFEGKLEQ